MDLFEKKVNPTPEDSANPLSRMFLLWLNPLIHRDKGRRRLSLDDLPDLPEELKAEGLGKDLDIAWSKECQDAKKIKARPRLYKALIKVFWENYVFCSFFLILDELIIRLVIALFLRSFISSFNDAKANSFNDRIFYSMGFLILSACDIMLINPVGLGFFRLGYRCGAAISSLIYRKLLKLSRTAQRRTTMGQIVNLLNVDCASFTWTLRWTPYLIYIPFQTILLTYYLWIELDSYCFIGVGIYIAVIPLQYLFGKFATNFKKETGGWTDARSQIMSEIIVSIRMIKIYGWEEAFIKLLKNARGGELKILRRSAFLKACISVMHSTLKIITYATIISYMSSTGAKQNGAEKVFFTISIFMIFRESLAGYIPLAASCFGELLASLKRIEDFLSLEERENDKSFLRTQIKAEESSIQLKNVDASWNGVPTLKDLSLKLRGSGLVIVSGAVGSGKSSLLSLLIEELPLSRGQAEVNGRISYASQDPWLFPGSVRQNIFFGTPPDEERYSKVLQVCALEEDLGSFPQGDATQVGERGVSLSGGQRSRINLARSLYRNADIYLLDDPLSSVDSQVSRHIFQRGILEFLSGKLVLLVTHHLQYAPLANQVLILKEGSLIKDPELHTEKDFGIPYENQKGLKKNGLKRNPSQNKIEKNYSFECKSNLKQTQGLQPLRIVFEYLSSGNSFLKLMFIISSFVIFQTLDQTADFWLSFWTDKSQDRGRMNSQLNLMLFCVILFGVLLFSILRAFSYYFFSLKISRNIHKRMVSSVLGAKVEFFDRSQSGRILNRFTKDINVLDVQFPASLFECLFVLLNALGALIIVAITNTYSIVVSISMASMLWNLKKKYMDSYEELKQLEYQMRSPLITHLSASVQGLPTIRSSNSQGRITEQFDKHLNNNGSPQYLLTCTTRWFSIRTEVLGLALLAFVTLTFLFIERDAGTVGLTITSIVAISGTLKWGMRQLAESEVMMSSVERTLEYTRIPPEETPLEEYKKMSKEWPSEGGLSFSGVSLSYDGRNDVLKGLEFQVRPLEKVGVIGRTGAGKSSIVAALLRIKETTGIIRIDGVDIKRVPIQRLRNSVSVIPQNPVLFSGSVRFNLDPFGVYSEEELRNAIDQVELGEVVKSLDDIILEEGSNLSVGQRQLLCLARALLRKNRILILDEATANVDQTTDRLIQKTLKNNFRDCTKLVIAHRLNSILDSDRILVIDNGQIKEFDQPKKLLQKKDGIFRMLVENAEESIKLECIP